VIVRGDTMISAPLSLLFDDPTQNIRLAPHDQVRLVSRDRKFSTFGAFGHVTEMPILDERLTLASAISRNGGLDTYSADNSAVFVFRFERPEVARALGATSPVTPRGVPVVYRLNMRDPSSYFTAANFEIEPEDMVYVPRSSSIGVKKFLDLVSVVTSVTYTAAVTGANVP
jgi:polysaccharide export outer membrane protein